MKGESRGQRLSERSPGKAAIERQLSKNAATGSRPHPDDRDFPIERPVQLGHRSFDAFASIAGARPQRSFARTAGTLATPASACHSDEQAQPTRGGHSAATSRTVKGERIASVIGRTLWHAAKALDAALNRRAPAPARQ